MDLKSTYNKIAQNWADEHASSGFWWTDSIDKFASFLPKGGVVLDVGCGVGQKAEYLAKKGFKVFALDFSEEMIKLAKKKVGGVKFSVQDMNDQLDFREKFDGIYAQAVLLHVPKKDVVKVIKNITESLKTGGYIYIAVKKSRPGSADEQVIKDKDYGYEYERFFSFFTLDGMVKYIEEASLSIVYKKETSTSLTTWVQIIAKK